MKNTMMFMVLALTATTVFLSIRLLPQKRARSRRLSAMASKATIKGSDQVFTGKMGIAPLYPANNDMRSSSGSVTFEPGARSN